MKEKSKSFKEQFAKFCENPDRIKFRELIKNNTGEYDHIDFKKLLLEKQELAKDVLGFANAGGGVLVFGVEEENDGSLKPVGLDALTDKTVIKQKLQRYLPSELEYEIHNFEFGNDVEWGPIRNKNFQVLEVRDTPQHLPFLSMRAHGDTLHKNRVYCRSKCNTEEATHEELNKIINRRLDTNVSTTAEDAFKEHLTQLKLLYSLINKYNVKAPIWMNVSTLSLFGEQVENEKYPEENFEDFIIRMIERKKNIIENLILLRKV